MEGGRGWRGGGGALCHDESAPSWWRPGQTRRGSHVLVLWWCGCWVRERLVSKPHDAPRFSRRRIEQIKNLEVRRAHLASDGTWTDRGTVLPGGDVLTDLGPPAWGAVPPSAGPRVPSDPAHPPLSPKTCAPRPRPAFAEPDEGEEQFQRASTLP